MAEIELKPCPFCGGVAVPDRYIRDGKEVYCGKCGASTHAFNPCANEKAAERWNTRVAHDNLQSDRDALLKACKIALEEVETAVGALCVSWKFGEREKEASLNHPNLKKIRAAIAQAEAHK